MLKVRAGNNGPVMREGARRRIDGATGRDVAMIYGDDVVEVPETRYYARRIQMGDLVVVTEAEPKKTEQPAAGGRKE